jgi:hypothetical protein
MQVVKYWNGYSWRSFYVVDTSCPKSFSGIDRTVASVSLSGLAVARSAKDILKLLQEATEMTILRSSLDSRASSFRMTPAERESSVVGDPRSSHSW